ncbi:hypothetical protein [Streptomyces sp. V1I6]|uniref:hypothetical protein n=1 Tax=Streptomyces sp. V1I6 TaxID=3042273 RepID=UPI002787B958|nr:hypothetical protein [Streptomyces sp. V1I6]MDQ0842386.1 hypothetical protein [Streptomyces sp. V1I6]
MNYNADALREASERSGVPFGYLMRLAAAEERDPQDPEGNAVLGKQLTVVFDHYVAKCLAEPDPAAALRRFGFTESAAALDGSQNEI